ncbi:MAG: hypothetical protein ACK4V6_11655, partial [Microthrixaceae bacterium]
MESTSVAPLLLAQVPTGIGHWLLAVSPIVVLAVLLIGLRWKAAEAGPVGLLLAVASAVLVFGIDLGGLFADHAVEFD